ncbi:hypothetical protein CCUS01_02268 [Colletotrichum cuscutae]|uniref:Uncharacterized protein n=1 Tax=Colletotrichum cuscutae TaxID=1209917 RepID=A0AAI9XJZ1_9PEZI|nr:hypothetical protein CCUS01_02268 [Colletotrichum cuscutae]
MIIADFFFGVPIAVMRPQMPYLLAPVDFTPTSEKASIWFRIRNEIVFWTREMRKRQVVKHSVPVAPKPNHLVFTCHHLCNTLRSMKATERF